MTTRRRRRGPLVLIAIAAMIGLAGCSGAAPSAASSAGQPQATPTAPNPSGAAGGVDPGGGGGGAPGDPGTGVGVDPAGPGTGVGSGPANPGPIDPGAGQPTLVRPVPGRADPHPVAPIAIQTSIDGRHVLVKIIWYGGIEPCSVLDSVRIERAGNDIAVTPFEGASDGSVACIDIAILKATIVDLGELEPGTYRISSPDSNAPAAVITLD